MDMQIREWEGARTWGYICAQMRGCGGTRVGKCARAGGHGEVYVGGNKLGMYVGMWTGTGAGGHASACAVKCASAGVRRCMCTGVHGCMCAGYTGAEVRG